MSDAQKLIETWTQFKNRGWMPGDSGALLLLCHITEKSKKIYVTPHKPRKASLALTDLFILRELYDSADILKPLNEIDDSLTLTEWAPTMLQTIAAFPSATCVAQVSTVWSALATRLALFAWKTKSEAFPNAVRISHWGLLKDLGFNHEVVIPVIDYSDRDRMTAATKEMLSYYPQTCALLVRDYGMVVWAESLLELERKIEALETLLELQIREFNMFSKLD